MRTNIASSKPTFTLLTILGLVLAFGVTNAHVSLLAPNGAEVLQSDNNYTIRWQVDLEHLTQNWDLDYSITGATGPWIAIATDLPVGDPTAGSIHTYSWNVPDVISNQVRVRVKQDNGGGNYYDYSTNNLSIVYDCCNGVRGNANADGSDAVNISDVTFLVDYLFGIPLGPTPPCSEEGNANGDAGGNINISDVTYLVDYLFGIPLGPAPAACP